MELLGLAVLTIVLGASLAYDCDDIPYINGCSVWNIVPYKRRFTSSCNKHDVCYACGRTFGISRLRCDKAFKTNMRKACRGGWWCNRWAYIYYKAVRIFGSNRFKASKHWCRDEVWYRTECMPK